MKYGTAGRGNFGREARTATWFLVRAPTRAGAWRRLQASASASEHSHAAVQRRLPWPSAVASPTTSSRSHRAWRPGQLLESTVGRPCPWRRQHHRSLRREPSYTRVCSGPALGSTHPAHYLASSTYLAARECILVRTAADAHALTTHLQSALQFHLLRTLI